MKTNRLFASGILLFSMAAAVAAHEYWLDPREPAPVGAEVPLDAFSGMEFVRGERKDLTPEKLQSLRAVDGAGSRDLLHALAAGLDARSVKTRCGGASLVVLQSRHAYLELDAAKFNDYLREEGLDEILELRKRTGRSDEASREIYQRCAKTVFRVVEPNATAEQAERSARESRALCTQPAGLPLEIVPGTDPTRLKVGDTLSLQLLMHGKPRANALFQVFRRNGPRESPASRPARGLRSDASGALQIAIDGPGEWLIATVAMVEAANGADPRHPEAQWESFWASLTFVVEGVAQPASKPVVPAGR